jgi:hypothetical protein
MRSPGGGRSLQPIRVHSTGTHFAACIRWGLRQVRTGSGAVRALASAVRRSTGLVRWAGCPSRPRRLPGQGQLRFNSTWCAGTPVNRPQPCPERAFAISLAAALGCRSSSQARPASMRPRLLSWALGAPMPPRPLDLAGSPAGWTNSAASLCEGRLADRDCKSCNEGWRHLQWWGAVSPTVDTVDGGLETSARLGSTKKLTGPAARAWTSRAEHRWWRSGRAPRRTPAGRGGQAVVVVAPRTTPKPPRAQFVRS